MTAPKLWKFIKTKKHLTLEAALFLLSLVTLVNIWLSNSATHDSISPSDHGTYNSSGKSIDQHNSPANKVAPVSTNTDSPSNTTSGGSSSSSAPSGSYGNHVITPTYPPFSIATVNMSASYSCFQKGVVLTLSSASVTAGSPIGGNFSWQIEVSGAANPYSPDPTTNTIPVHDEGTYYLQNPSQPGSSLFYDYQAKDGESVRVHVTSPNSIASNWYTVPTGSADQCASQ